MPGRRLKLARQDLYALGAHRGGIDERWFASTTAGRQREAPRRTRASATSSTTASRFTLRGRHRAARRAR